MYEVNRNLYNEQLMLAAQWVNGISIAIAAIGVAAPWLALAHSAASDIIYIFIGASACFAMSFVMHLWAKRLLRKLKR